MNAPAFDSHASRTVDRLIELSDSIRDDGFLLDALLVLDLADAVSVAPPCSDPPHRWGRPWGEDAVLAVCSTCNHVITGGPAR